MVFQDGHTAAYYATRKWSGNAKCLKVLKRLAPQSVYCAVCNVILLFDNQFQYEEACTSDSDNPEDSDLG